MRVRRPRRVTPAAIAFTAIVALVSPLAPASAAEYPTWDDVEQAQRDEGATQREIAHVSDALDTLDAEAARLGDAAVTASERSFTSQSALEQATLNTERLEAQLKEAREAEASALKTAGAVASRLARTGQSLTPGLVFSSEPDQLLSALSSLEQLGKRNRLVVESATRSKNTSAALGEQAAVARQELEDRSAAAAAAAADAAAAAAAADETARTTQRRQSELYEQLAALKDTTATTERDFRVGQNERRAFEEQQAAARAQAELVARDAGAQARNNHQNTAAVRVDAGSTPERERQNDPTARPTPQPPPAPAPPAPVLPPTPPQPGIDTSPAASQRYAARQVSARGWNNNEFSCLVRLWNRESGWNHLAMNPSSGAYGIPQSLPGSKMASAGVDWRTNPHTQINWGLSYISGRYGTPCKAWAHSEAVNWY